jgi:hypothetical protein
VLFSPQLAVVIGFAEVPTGTVQNGVSSPVRGTMRCTTGQPRPSRLESGARREAGDRIGCARGGAIAASSTSGARVHRRCAMHDRTRRRAVRRETISDYLWFYLYGTGLWHFGLEKQVSFMESIAIRSEFQAAFMGAGGPPGKLMVSADMAIGGSEDLYLRLPNLEMLAAFVGFEPVNGSELPAQASLNCGHYDQFEKLFESACASCQPTPHYVRAARL